MKLATFSHRGRRRLGVVVDDHVADVLAVDPTLPSDLAALLAAGPSAMAAVERAAKGAGNRIALGSIRLEAPIARPGKFLAIGLNYRDHVDEMGRELPTFPVFFNKQVTCINGPFDPIHRPRVSDELDYEGELGFVVGRRCRHVPRERAHEVVAGFLVVNDVSVRDWQRRAPTMTLGKSFDTHGPTGPWLTTLDEIGDPNALGIRTWVNGELRQDSDTSRQIFDYRAQIEVLSTVCTLEPGDIVSTGTPAGVGFGMDPPRFLSPGDRVRIAIERIGSIENEVVDEPQDGR